MIDLETASRNTLSLKSQNPRQQGLKSITCAARIGTQNTLTPKKVCLRYQIIDIARPRRQQEVPRHLLRDLPGLGPRPDGLEVPTLVVGVEIDKRLHGLGKHPDLPEDADVDGAHQLLADDVHAVRGVHAHDVIVVHEGALAERLVVVVVPLQGLPHQVEAVEVMQAFDVGGVAAAVFGVDLDVVGRNSGGGGLVFGDDYWMIWRRDRLSSDDRRGGRKQTFRAESFPCCVYFWAGCFSVFGLVQKGPIEGLDFVVYIQVFQNRRCLSISMSWSILHIVN